MTVRVPAEKLEDALAQFRALAVDVENQRVDSQDVTEEYVDLEARLTNMQRTERELQELLESRSETGKTSDILEVHRELTNIRAQIEQIQGRMQYLENLSAMATVQIQLTPDALMQPVVVGGWRPQGTARDAVRMLLRTLQFLADAAIVSCPVYLARPDRHRHSHRRPDLAHPRPRAAAQTAQSRASGKRQRNASDPRIFSINRGICSSHRPGGGPPPNIEMIRTRL